MPHFPALLRLDGDRSSLLVVHESASILPRLAWFGARIPEALSATDVTSLHDNALAYATLDAYCPLDVLPQTSTGFMGSPALRGHRGATHFAHQFTLSEAKLDDNRIVLTLDDTAAGLRIMQALSLHPDCDVLGIRTTLYNNGDSPFDVDWLAAATVPLPAHFTHCITQHGRWGREFQSAQRKIRAGRIDITNLHGRTSHEHAPSVICSESPAHTDHGDMLYAHLAWSGNYSFRIEQLSDGNQYLQAGVYLQAGESELQPGEILRTPELLLARGNGLNECTQRFHHYARAHVLPAWSRTPRPIHANSWEAMYFDHDVENLLALIDASASIGAERFVLDDGWFLNRRNDRAGLGDWYVDKGIYPDGLQPLVDRVRQHNMEFGLWFEPEMVNPDSELYRQHPEWVLQLNNVSTPLARDQLALDISRADVSDYLFTRITSLVRQYAIDYIKWDMNRDLVLPGDGASSKAAAQPVALYALMDRITQACPELQIETCSSGGARSDLGVLKHTGRVWTSDNIDPIERASIQQGFLRFLPPEIMGAHVGHEHAHLTGRSTGLHTRAIVALQGQFGFELDARKLDVHDITTLQHYTNLYKRNRHWMSNATYWQLPDSTDALLSCGLVAQDKQTALFNVILLQSLATTRPGSLRLRGLDKSRHYTVTLASTNLEELVPFNKAMPAWCNEPLSASGDMLMKTGLPLPVLPPQSAILVRCTADQAA